MIVLTLFAWALMCFFFAFVSFLGIRKGSLHVGFAAFISMMILGGAGYDALLALNVAMQAYAMGEAADFQLTGSVWALAALLFVWWFTPSWLTVRKHEPA
jgi:hypothetical protein